MPDKTLAYLRKSLNGFKILVAVVIFHQKMATNNFGSKSRRKKIFKFGASALSRTGPAL